MHTEAGHKEHWGGRVSRHYYLHRSLVVYTGQLLLPKQRLRFRVLYNVLKTGERMNRSKIGGSKELALECWPPEDE